MSLIQRDVCSLIYEQRWAALATTGSDGPTASMVAYAPEPGLNGLLIYISQLAAHTGQLLAHPDCSLAISVPDGGLDDPQLLPRVSLRGKATPIARDSAGFAAAAACYVERLPAAAPRLALTDFQLFRFVFEEARFVGGFARAARFEGDPLRKVAVEMGL